MLRFKNIFNKAKCNIIGMIHVDSLPGTPKYKGNFNNIIEKAKHEAHLYKKYNIDSVLVENMHDIPYIQDKNIGPEIIAGMTRIITEIRQIIRDIPIGVQILACGNKQALAVAKSTDCQFIRVEGFVYSHIADEGFTDANAGKLLRYRKQIDATNILVFTDIKKKHSSHSITDDISLVDTAHAAEFFLSDGIIITGSATGDPTNPNDLNLLHGNIKLPILIGSGVTLENLKDYHDKSNGIIIGSYFKENGSWENELCEKRLSKFLQHCNEIRNK